MVIRNMIETVRDERRHTKLGLITGMNLSGFW